MRLCDLLKNIPDAQCPKGFDGLNIETISCDSREEQQDGLFVALSGFNFNGADFIKDAIAHGAKAIVKTDDQYQIGAYRIPDEVAVIKISDPKQFLRQAAVSFYGQPSSKVKAIGITGTNGKTTTTYLLESIIHADQKKCGVIGTVNYRIGDKIIPSINTTPGFLDNQRLLSKLAHDHVHFCVMEASSHALHQGRVDAIDFAAGIFTNLTQDHLDYHTDMEQYFQAKALLFKGLSSQAFALINTDDAYGQRLVPMSKGVVLTYGIDTQADVKAEHIEYQLSKTRFNIVFPGGALNIATCLVGKHNVYNILSAASCVYALGFPMPAIQQGIENLKNVPGRLESVDTGGDFFVFIDYAHTEDGLVNVLKSLRAVSENKIIVVFGCGGDRDKGKRPKMGKVVCELADHAIVTSDNPRSEDPHSIIDEIVKGFDKENFETCIDRKEAIGRALKMAQKGDIVLLAGKGHEQKQILKDKTIEFNERNMVMELLRV